MNPPNLNYSLIRNPRDWYAIYDASTDSTTGFGELLTAIKDVIVNGKDSFLIPDMWSTVYRYNQYPLTNDINEITLPFVKCKYPELFI